jgi:hypothetical protein
MVSPFIEVSLLSPDAPTGRVLPRYRASKRRVPASQRPFSYALRLAPGGETAAKYVIKKGTFRFNLQSTNGKV